MSDITWTDIRNGAMFPWDEMREQYDDLDGVRRNIVCTTSGAVLTLEVEVWLEHLCDRPAELAYIAEWSRRKA